MGLALCSFVFDKIGRRGLIILMESMDDDSRINKIFRV